MGWVGEFALLALIVELTPGPNMFYLVALAIGRGRRAGLVAVAGVAGGLLCYGLVAAVGLSALLAAAPALWTFLHWAGALYMLWLAVETWRDRGAANAAPKASDAVLMARGFVVNILNPKTALFYVAALGEFADPAVGDVRARAFELVGVYVAIATAVHVAIVMGASLVHAAAGVDARVETRVRRTLAVALAAIAVWLFLTPPR